MSEDFKDITPEDSVTPVYLDTTPQVPLESGPWEQIEAQIASRASGIAKLMKLGLTEEEALAIAGG